MDKNKILIVIDFQNDFVTGSLGTPQALAIVPKVKAKIDEYNKNGIPIIFTRDTHDANYLNTQEGKLLPVIHGIEDTEGWNIYDDLDGNCACYVNKNTFGFQYWNNVTVCKNADEIELIGLCTDVCVVSNALILKATYPEVKITVDASCCAGVTEESHKAALLTMKSCQINVINE